MGKENSDIFDEYIDMVKKDPAKIDDILADNEDIRGELEPILRTAIRLVGVEHPIIMPGKKRMSRESIVTNEKKIPENLWVSMLIPPDLDAPGKHLLHP